VPGMFGGQFLTRPRFGPPGGPHGLAALGGLNNINNNTHQSISPHRAMPGPPSEDSNDERGKFVCLPSAPTLFTVYIYMGHMCGSFFSSLDPP
jgi:hypothetical protein